MSKVVFLGGTCNGSQWREALIPSLNISHFNPVVENWTPECQEEEVRQRETCDFCLYVITPRMTGTYSIAEVADDSNKRPAKTVFCFVESDHFGLSAESIEREQDSTSQPLTFNAVQVKSLKAVGKLVEANGAKWCQNLDEVASYLNAQ